MKQIDSSYLDPLYLDLDMHANNDLADTSINEMVNAYKEFIRLTVLKHNLNASVMNETPNQELNKHVLAQFQILDESLNGISANILRYIGLCTDKFEQCSDLIATYNNCMQKLGVILHEHRM